MVVIPLNGVNLTEKIALETELESSYLKLKVFFVSSTCAVKDTHVQSRKKMMSLMFIG